MLEIVVVIGLLVLVSTVIVASYANLIEAASVKPAERIFREAVRESRILAGTEKVQVDLRFDREQQAFVIIGKRTAPETDLNQSASWLLGDEEETEAVSNELVFPLETGEDWEIEFFPRLSKEDISRFSDDYSRTAIPFLSFHPSGVHTPARIRFKDGYNTQMEMTIDAFCSGPAFDEKEQRF